MPLFRPNTGERRIPALLYLQRDAGRGWAAALFARNIFDAAVRSVG